jgi:Concanavalin A-like lectin/glucanases superfamily
VASPVDAGRVGTNITTATTSTTVNLPSGIAAGDVLILFARVSAGGLNVPAGWTALINVDASDASDDQTSVLYRKADGSEGTTLNVTLNASAKGAVVVWRITGAADPATQAPQASSLALFTTAANAALPPSISPTGGSKDYLFLILAGLDGETQTFTAPSGYSNLVSANSGTGAAAASNDVIAGASRQATTATETPGASFLHAGASSGGNAITVAIHPSGTFYNQAPSGGVALGGSAANTRAFAKYPSGGLILGGSVSTSGIVGMWPLDENPAIHGTTVADASGNGNAGTLVTNDGSTNKSVSGKVGTAITFDGVDDHIDLGTSVFNGIGAGDFTVTAWVRNTGQTTRDIIVGKDNSVVGTRQLYLCLNTDYNGTVRAGMVAGMVFGPTDADGGGIDTALGAVSLNAWHLIVYRRQSGVQSIWIDGVNQSASATIRNTGAGTSGLTIRDTAAICQIGGRQYSGFTDNFTGDIDEVRVYSLALSDTQIADLFAAGGVTYTVAPSGGVILGGTRTYGLTRTSAPTGGLRLDGSCVSDIPSGITYAYQWQRDVGGNNVFSDIPGATSSTYTIVSADAGCNIRCVVTATDATGSRSAVSNVVGPVSGAIVHTSAPTGGIRLGGSVAHTLVRAHAPSGGIVLGGTRVESITRSYSKTGGIVLGGVATSLRAFVKAPSGGLVLGGTRTMTIARSYVSSGGVRLGGSVTYSKAYTRAVSGGLALGGTRTTLVTRSYTRSGGLVLGGSTTSSYATGTNVFPTGGIKFGGTRATSYTIAYSLSAGIRLSGSVSDTRSLARSVSGGLVLGGTRTTSISRSYARSAGIVLGGTCSSSIVVSGAVFPVGGIRLGGATTSLRALSLARSAGVRLGGTCTSTISVSGAAFPSGGVRLGGSVTVSRALSYARTGGVRLSGATQSSKLLLSLRAGGVVFGGSSTLVTARTYTSTPTGGVKFNGARAVSVVFALAKSGGIVFNGSLKVAEMQLTSALVTSPRARVYDSSPDWPVASPSTNGYDRKRTPIGFRTGPRIVR